MALKAILEALDEVDASIHDQYKEVELPKIGKRFVLQVEGVDELPAVRGLKTALDTVKADREKIRGERDAFVERFEGVPEEFDADAYKDLAARAEGKGGKPTDEQLAAVRASIEQKAQKEVEKRDKRIQTLEGEVRRSKINDGLTAALGEAGVQKEFIPAARALLESKGIVKLEEQDGAFSAIVETDLGPTPLAKFVPEWAQTDEGKIFIAKPQGGDAGGGNNRPLSGGPNPFAVVKGADGVTVKPNMTEMATLIRDNPVRARQLAKQAGWEESKINW